MSELSPEIIINDFEKLNDSENNEIKKEKCRPMDSLAKIFKNKNDNSYDYQQLD